MDANFKIKGLKELNKELKSLPSDMRNKALAGATGAAARLIRDQAISNAPDDTGNLKGAIRSQKKKGRSKWVSKYQVNIKPKGKITILTRGKNRRSNSTYYARFIEDGTVKHPAAPFMRPAYQAKKEQAVQEFKRVLSKKIDFYNRKIKRLRA